MLAAGWDLSLVILLLAAGFGVGSALLGRWAAPELEPMERYLFGTVLGLGVLAIGVTALGSLGLLGRAPLAALLLAGAALGWKGLGDAPSGFRNLVELLRDARTVAGGVAAVVLGLAAGILVLEGLTPVTDWDSLMYHLRVPVQFLEYGSIYVPEDNLHTAYVGLIHMLYLPLLALGSTAGPALLSGSLAFLLGLAILAAGVRLFGGVAGACGAILLWGSGLVFLVASTPRVDVSLALFLFLAHYALILQLETGGRVAGGGLVVAAALAGLAVGVKYQALAYAGPLVLLGLWVGLRTLPLRKQRLRVAGACGAIFLAAAAAMPLKNLVLFGGPLYPFLAERVIPPWLAAITGSSGHPPGAGSDIYWLIAQAREPFNVVDLFLRPGALTVEAEAWASVTNPAFVLLPLALLFYRNRTLMALLLPPIGYLLLVLIPFEFTNLRYLIPVIPVFTLVSVEVARRLLERLATREVAGVLLVVGSVAAILPAARAAGERFVPPDRVRAAVGILPSEHYLARAPVAGFSQYWNARNRVHESTGPDARILFLFEGRGLYFERDVLQDNVLTNWPLLRATDAPDTCLERTGITHVLMNLGALAYYQGRGMDPTPLGLEDFQPFHDRCLEPVFNEGGFVFLRVLRPERPPSSSIRRNDASAHLVSVHGALEPPHFRATIHVFIPSSKLPNSRASSPNGVSSNTPRMARRL